MLKSYNLQNRITETLNVSGISRMPSMQFDDFGNNLYWCDWDTLTIEAISLKTLSRTIIFTGSVTEVPMELALVPEKG